MADALARRLQHEHAAYTQRRDAALVALADTLWRRAAQEPMTGWVVHEVMPRTEKAFFTTPAPPQLKINLTWTAHVTEPVQQLVDTLRGMAGQEYEDELLRALQRTMAQHTFAANNDRYSIEAARSYGSSRDREEKPVLFVRINYELQ